MPYVILRLLSLAQGVCHLVLQRVQFTKGGYPTKKNHVREILTPEIWQANVKKLLMALTFLLGCVRSTPAACSSLSVQDCGALTGAPAGLGRHLHLYLFGNSLNLRIAKFH